MPTLYKVLGQSAPAATTNANVYTVPAATEAIVNTIAVCNRGVAQGTYRLAVRPNGATLANQHYFVFDTVINANDTVNPDITLSLSSGDVITVYASSANFSFLVSGVEITA